MSLRGSSGSWSVGIGSMTGMTGTPFLFGDRFLPPASDAGRPSHPASGRPKGPGTGGRVWLGESEIAHPVSRSRTSSSRSGSSRGRAKWASYSGPAPTAGARRSSGACAVTHGRCLATLSRPGAGIALRRFHAGVVVVCFGRACWLLTHRCPPSRGVAPWSHPAALGCQGPRCRMWQRLRWQTRTEATSRSHVPRVTTTPFASVYGRRVVRVGVVGAEVVAGVVGGTRVVTGGGAIVGGTVLRVTGTAVVLAELENLVVGACVSGDAVTGASVTGA